MILQHSTLDLVVFFLHQFDGFEKNILRVNFIIYHFPISTVMADRYLI